VLIRKKRADVFHRELAERPKQEYLLSSALSPAPQQPDCPTQRPAAAAFRRAPPGTAGRGAPAGATRRAGPRGSGARRCPWCCSRTRRAVTASPSRRRHGRTPRHRSRRATGDLLHSRGQSLPPSYVKSTSPTPPRFYGERASWLCWSTHGLRDQQAALSPAITF